MSFGVAPNSISCYYILNRSISNIVFNGSEPIIQQLLPTFGGDISGDSLTLLEVQTRFPGFQQLPDTIIVGHENLPNTSFIVGIPQKNGNNLSRNQILTLMKEYNIGRLRNIIPFVNLAGNERTVIDPNNCLDPADRKKDVLRYKIFGNVRELNQNEIRQFSNVLSLSRRRFCVIFTNFYR